MLHSEPELLFLFIRSTLHQVDFDKRHAILLSQFWGWALI